MDVVKLAIHGTGYPLPGGYDGLFASSQALVASSSSSFIFASSQAPAWEFSFGSSSFQFQKLEIGNQRNTTGSLSFPDWVPKLELGNQ